MNDCLGVAGDYDVAVLALDDVADSHALVMVHLPSFTLRRFVLRQAAHFEQQRRLVAVIDDERVRRLGGVLVAQASADGQRERGDGILTQEPAANIHLVGPLVAVIAVAVVPKPVPVIVHRAETAVAPRRFVLGRAAPDIVVNVIGHGLRAVHQANALAAFVTEAAGENDLAQVAIPHVFHRFLQPHRGTALRAALDDPLILAGGLDHLAALKNVMAGRLLHVNVLARLARPDGRQRVPVVRHGDGDRVHVLVLQQLADVRIGLDAVAELLGFGLQDVPVHVAEGHQAHAFHFAQGADVAGALAPEANLRDADIAVRAGGPAPGASVKTECSGANGGCLEEVTACKVHDSLLYRLGIH